MIKIISFDIGGTLIKIKEDQDNQKYDFKALTKIVNSTYDKVREAYKSVFQKSKGSKEELINKFCHLLNIESSKELEEFFTNKFKGSTSEISNQNIEIIKRLKSQGYKIILLSNNCCLLDNKISDEVLNLIDGIFNSFEIGYTKNEAACYRFVEQQMGYEPNEFLHIGDSLKSDYFCPIQNGWNSLFYGISTEPNVVSIQSLDEVFDYLNCLNKSQGENYDKGRII